MIKADAIEMIVIKKNMAKIQRGALSLDERHSIIGFMRYATISENTNGAKIGLEKYKKAPIAKVAQIR